MRRILWLGNPYFATSLQTCGWEDVVTQPFKRDPNYTWQDIVDSAGFEPDIVVVADSSLQPPVRGIESFPCLTIFYSAKTSPLSWEPKYAQAFDACLVTMTGRKNDFAGDFLTEERIWCSPPFASEEAQPHEAARQWDCLFVGTFDALAKPARHQFLANLSQQVPSLHVACGEYHKLFPQGRVVINHSEHNALDFRVFEALGCGCCLVTPRVGNGLEKLFVDGEHLVGYTPGDAGDAAYRIKFLLENPELCKYIADTGLAEINAAHRPRHRAEAFTDLLCDLALTDLASLISARRDMASTIRNKYLMPLYLQGND